MYSSNLTLRSMFEAVALALTLVALWLLMHGYHGLTGDGEIYALQALARLHPYLATDLFLENNSQDRYTWFSPLYAWCIRLLGVQSAARWLALLFILWFLAAVWGFARTLAGRKAAWAAVAFLLIATGSYGGSGVFRVLDSFLTARLPAQALIVTALYCQSRGERCLGLSLAAAALLIHPLMALPGLLLVICLWLPLRVGVIGAIGGLFATFAISVIAVYVPGGSRFFTVMDIPWLAVVQERSQFLFLQLWSMRDWYTNLQPFVCLGFMAIVMTDARMRKLCAAAALVGATGLAVAFIGGFIGPVAILVQGQAWRWVWITVLIAAVLLPCAALRVVQDEKCGLLCAMLLISGWILPAPGAMGCVGLATAVWLIRAQISLRAAPYLRWACAGLGIAIGIWMFVECRDIAWSAISQSAGRSSALPELREIFALRVPAVLFAALVAWGLRIRRATWVPVLLSAMLAGFSVLIFPVGFRQPRMLDSASNLREFQDWRTAIPPTSTVLVAPSRDVGTFVWFTLDRPNYLALDQSSGVVFSRASALEIRRRSEVLLPLMDPDWMIRTQLRSRSVGGRKQRTATHPLTTESLIHVCGDPRLGFVISPERVGFDPLPHAHAGAWKDWNLYDCGNVRASLPIP